MIYIYYKGARFGNWLFQYAVAKTLAKDGPVAWYFEDPADVRVLEPYAEMFKDVERVFALPKDTVILTDEMVAERGLGSYKDAPNLAIVGLVQNPTFFDDDIAHAAFRVPVAVDREIRQRCAKMFESPERVSVHVRRGDYLNLPHRFPFVGENYLKTAVEKFSSTALIVVCSDDLPWCKKFFSTERFPGRKFYFVEGGTVLSDFYTVTYCHHNICSNSTFGWWGSWLNPNPGKRVIMPKRWFGVDIRQSSACFYYKGVEVVDNPPSWGMRVQIGIRESRAILGRFVRGRRQGENR